MSMVAIRWVPEDDVEDAVLRCWPERDEPSAEGLWQPDD